MWLLYEGGVFSNKYSGRHTIRSHSTNDSRHNIKLCSPLPRLRSHLFPTTLRMESCSKSENSEGISMS